MQHGGDGTCDNDLINYEVTAHEVTKTVELVGE